MRLCANLFMRQLGGRNIKRFTALIIASALAASSAAAESVTSRNGGPSAADMTARNSAGAPEGTAFFRPVLSGVLYRSGFSGGDKQRTGLSQSQRGALCDAGFSKAFYADFGKNTSYGVTNCASGTLDYESARSSRPSNVLKAVHETIKNPSEGPVLIHCMWGVHASGALSAMSLVQFCGWSESRAKEYWDEARNGAPCSGGCDKWIDAKFAKFKMDPNLTITDAERAAICPK